MQPTLAYHGSLPQINEDPDGTLHIDIAAAGWRKALRIKSAAGLAIGLVFGFVALLVPLVVVLIVMRGKPDLYFAFFGFCGAEAFAVLLLSGIYSVQARRSAHIRVTPTELVIEEFGVPLASKLHMHRDEIKWLAAGRIGNRQSDQSAYLWVRRNRWDTSDNFLGHLSEEETQRIARLIQEKLQLPPAACQIE